ncbi:MAG: FHA domain-containing protein [Candidatus Promineifilaceae bacterium]|nr:FHA domain-containing protein [Candidatus Promineifilaceae bacterium]
MGSQIHYLITASGRQGELDCHKPIWVGRADPDQGYWPQLDLTGDGAVELGVSRRHALIQLSDQGPVLVDQHSTNGTWINQEQLIPDKPYPLPRVAQLRFGRLLLRTFLE